MKFIQHGLLIQIANFEIWNKIKYITNNFDTNKSIIMININFDLITIDEINLIINEYPNAIITYSPNKGMDIYGFFKQIEYIIENNIIIDNICKIHTKTDEEWRSHLIEKLCGTKDIISKNIKLLSNDIGLLCPKKYLINIDHFNNPVIIKLLRYWNINNIYIDEINWKLKKKYILDHNKIDWLFYVTYPYNNINYNEKSTYYKGKVINFAYNHWKNYGSKTFRFVPNSDMIIKKNTYNYKFPAGTMFWIKGYDLRSFFKKYIKFEDFYECFEYGYIDNQLPTLTHSFERIFGLIPILRKKINLPI